MTGMEKPFTYKDTAFTMYRRGNFLAIISQNGLEVVIRPDGTEFQIDNHPEIRSDEVEWVVHQACDMILATELQMQTGQRALDVFFDRF